MVQIKIDGRTIKKYRRYTRVYLNCKLILRVKEEKLEFLWAKIKEIALNFGSVSFNTVVSAPDHCLVEIYCVDKKAFTKLKKLAKLKSVSIHSESMSLIDTMLRDEINYMKQLPEWKYDYLPTKVRCKHCGAEFPWTELETYYPDECGFYKIEDICPKCMEENCCSYKFETMDEYLARKGKKLNG